MVKLYLLKVERGSYWTSICKIKSEEEDSVVGINQWLVARISSVVSGRKGVAEISLRILSVKSVANELPPTSHSRFLRKAPRVATRVLQPTSLKFCWFLSFISSLSPFVAIITNTLLPFSSLTKWISERSWISSLY